MGECSRAFMAEINEHMPSQMAKIEHMWEDIGIPKEERLKETQTYVNMAKNLMERAFKKVQATHDGLIKDIEGLGKHALRSAKELGMVSVEPDENLNILELKDFLAKYVEELDQTKAKRMDELASLLEQANTLAGQLGEDHYPIAVDRVPTIGQLKALEEHTSTLRNEKSHRLCTYNALKGSIDRLNRLLEYESSTQNQGQTSFGKDSPVLTLAKLDEMQTLKSDLEMFVSRNRAEAERLRERLISLWELLDVPMEMRGVFLANNMEETPSTIEKLKAEVELMEVRKQENIQTYIARLRQEILVFWEKCMSGPAEKEAFRPYYSEEWTDAVLSQHEKYLKALQGHFFECKEIFERIGKRQELFQKMLDFERKSRNPDSARLNNRGGRLLQEERERKRLGVQIPKLENDIKNMVRHWESQHTMRFTVGGKNLPDFFEEQWAGYEKEKENERLQRQIAKTRIMEEEMANGAKSATMSGKLGSSRKRVFPGTPVTNRSVKSKLLTPASSMTRLTPLNQGCAYTLRDRNRQEPIGTPLGKPPVSTSKISQKKKVIPRRLHQKTTVNVSRNQTNSHANPTFNPFVAREPINSETLGTSTLSTYSEFQNNIGRKCLKDLHCRSSTVTPRSPPPGSPRRYRDRLGLPILI